MHDHYMAPRDVYELRLVYAWEEALGRDGIGVQDDFFAAGGDPARARAMLATVAVQLDVEVSLADLHAAPTIERLAGVLRTRAIGRNEAPVVALQPRGAGRPFFFVPSGEGNALNFYPLARRLGSERPFYSFQTRGLYGADAPIDHVEDKATEHVAAMRAIQPHGPYLLGGHCIGAIVALEMALQLQCCGERVALLAAVDAVAPAVFYADEDLAALHDQATFYVFISRGFRYWFGRDVALERAELLALEAGARPAYFMARARAHGIYPPDTADDRVTRVHDLFRRIIGTPYTPREEFAGPITFVRGRDSRMCETETGGWEGLSTSLRCRAVSGDHVTLVTEPHVEELARELHTAIAEAAL